MDRIDEAAERFARALSDCVNPVLPEGFKVIADSMELVISSPVRGLAAGGYDVRQFFDPIEAEPDGDDEPSQLTDDERADDLVGRLASGIEAFLGTLADDVSEALTVPWPQEKHARHPSMA